MSRITKEHLMFAIDRYNFKLETDLLSDVEDKYPWPLNKLYDIQEKIISLKQVMLPGAKIKYGGYTCPEISERTYDAIEGKLQQNWIERGSLGTVEKALLDDNFEIREGEILVKKPWVSWASFPEGYQKQRVQFANFRLVRQGKMTDEIYEKILKDLNYKPFRSNLYVFPSLP